MTLSIQPAEAGARGIDCITVLTRASAERLAAAGYRFAVRYLGSLTLAERDAILGAGLAILAVGFSRKPGWMPTAALGDSDAAAAIHHAIAAGLPAGMHLFCDLEGPSTAASSDDCIDYVNAWSGAVRAAGYLPGLYVGFGVPLTGAQLFHDLTVACYWHSCSAVPEVAVRGYCMRQDPRADQWIAGIQVDIDVIEPDAMGDVPHWVVLEATGAS